jgi:hypothetical protein
MRRRLVKDAGVDQRDGEVLGANTWDMPGQVTMHGRATKWELARATGNLMRIDAKPGIRGFSGSRAPGGSVGGSRRPSGGGR